jgi:hypothetical protein
MRSVILLDTKIDKDEALALLEDFSEFFEKHTGIEHEYWVERRDFSIVPTVVEADGDLKPTVKYRTDLNNEVHSRYGDFGTDNVIMWVHEDNFLYKGIWGQNWSYVYNKHSFQLCRWDKDNSTNTFNTLWHEIAHSLDAVVLKETGLEIDRPIEINFEVTNFDYDRDFVHGQSGKFPYIGRRGYVRNGEMLEFLAPYLRLAYGKRKEKHLEKLGLMTQIVKLLSTVVALLQKKK